jgi:hypothetical protein
LRRLRRQQNPFITEQKRLSLYQLEMVIFMPSLKIYLKAEASKETKKIYFFASFVGDDFSIKVQEFVLTNNHALSRSLFQASLKKRLDLKSSKRNFSIESACILRQESREKKDIKDLE